MIMNSYSSEENYQRVKKEVIGIISEHTRGLLFEEEHYYGPYYSYIKYKVDKVRLLKIKGVNHFIFEITFTVKDWGTIESIVYIENGVVYNSHRK